MPDQAEVRRQMIAYKLQVAELRKQYAKELDAKALQMQESKKAAARLSASGELFSVLGCIISPPCQVLLLAHLIGGKEISERRLS